MLTIILLLIQPNEPLKAFLLSFYPSNSKMYPFIKWNLGFEIENWDWVLFCVLTVSKRNKLADCALSVRNRKNLFFFFHEHSWLTGQQWNGEAIFLTTLYHFHLLYRHLEVNQETTPDSSPQHSYVLTSHILIKN